MEEALAALFHLDGDTVVRTATGKPVRTRGGSYPMVGFSYPRGVYHRVYLHRLVFFLSRGFMPPEVDHKDRDTGNATPSNVRAATRRQNLANRLTKNSRGMPRGVYPIHRKGKPCRYSAALTINKAKVYLGSFDTVADAEEAVIARLLQEHGDFYNGH